MWEMATYVLGNEYEASVRLGTGPVLITGLEDNVTRAVLFYKDRKSYFWEPQTLKLAMSLLPVSGIAIVAGGHIGYHALHLAWELQGRGGKVFVFEPIKKFQQRIVRGAALSNLGNVTVEHTALHSESCDEITFYISGAWSSINASIAHSATTEQVRCLSLDDYLKQIETNEPNLLLLDVEGNELEVLRGSSRLLESAPEIILEVNISALNKQGLSQEDLYRFLINRGYEIFAISDDYQEQIGTDNMTPIVLHPIHLNKEFTGVGSTWFNILATKNLERLRVANIIIKDKG